MSRRAPWLAELGLRAMGGSADRVKVRLVTGAPLDPLTPSRAPAADELADLRAEVARLRGVATRLDGLAAEVESWDLREFTAMQVANRIRAVSNGEGRQWPVEPSCGGCEGLGSHKRWCPAKVGAQASRWGRLSEQVDGLADQVGANVPAAANALYAAAALLRKHAQSVVFRRAQEPSVSPQFTLRVDGTLIDHGLLGPAP